MYCTEEMCYTVCSYYLHSFIHSFIIFHKSIFGYRHHWMWNLSIVYIV